MKKSIKKLSALLLALCLLIVPSAAVTASAEEGIMPYYNNVTSTYTAMNINSSGQMSIAYQYAGSSSKTTKAVITTYIEKKVLGLFWQRVNNGQPDNQWVDTIYKYEYSGYRKVQLNSSGTYRVKVQYKIYGSGGAADVIDYESEDSY